jgi:Fe(3+) dicitrate transport protein
VEFTLQYDPGLDRGWAFSNPWFLTATYTNARLLNDVSSADAGSLFAGGKRGNWVPYVPEWMFTMGTGVHFDLVGVDVTGIFVDETYTSASNTTALEDPDGNPDSRFGMTDDYFIWDFSGYARLTENVKLFGGIQNVFDLRYISSRHPYGPRPGAPLFGYMGVEAIY